MTTLVHTHRLPGDPDDTAAVGRALALGVPVRFVAGQGSGTGADAGKYIVNKAILPSRSTLFGDGAASIIKLPNGSEGSGTAENRWAALWAMGPSHTSEIEDLHIHDLAFEDDVVTRGFLEERHLISMAGVRRVLIERCRFTGFRGDAISLNGETATPGNLNAPSDPAKYRHNYDVTIRNCFFDGVNNNNRQGVTAGDAVRLRIQGCHFQNVCRRGDSAYPPGSPYNAMIPTSGPAMPGAIDFEPSPYDLYVMRDLVVEDCTFDNIGGNAGTVTVFCPAQVDAPPQGVTIRNNVFRNYSGDGCDVYVNMFRSFTASDADSAITVEGNSGHNGRVPFAIFSAKHVTFRGNEWRDYARPCLLAYQTGPGPVRDVLITGDQFHKVGTIGERSITISSVGNLRIEDSVFAEFGIASPASVAIEFAVGAAGLPGQSSGVELIRNRFSHSSAGAKAIGIGTHTPARASNREQGNIYGAHPRDFFATRTDVPQAVEPAVEGASGTGAPSLGDRGSVYWVEGGTCYIDYFITWSAHTGSGRLRVGLPVPPAEFYAPNGRRGPLAVEVSGTGGAAAAPNQVIASFNTQDMSTATTLGPNTINNDGSIHFYLLNQSTGALTSFAVPNAPTELRIRGFYKVKAA